MKEEKNLFDPKLKTLLERRFSAFMSPLEAFIHRQTTAGILLIIFSLVALLLANSPWKGILQEVSHMELGLVLGRWHFALSIGEWINQGLMALFFFLTGLEMKREIMAGELRHFHEVVLIIFAAVGGIVVPALVYHFINAGGPGQRGWGIPTATDTAFALGILALMAKRVSISMTIFLTALSLFDDIGAVLVMSIFYSHALDFSSMGVCVFLLMSLFLANRLGIRNFWVYGVLGVLLWVFVYQARIHGTFAGILLAVTIPVKTSISQHGFIRNIKKLVGKFEESPARNVEMLGSLGQHSILSEINKNVSAASTPLQRWETALIAPVAVIVLPLFALFNAGIPLSADLLLKAASSPVSLGIIFGLVVGKPLGILVFVFAGVKLKMGKLPQGISWNAIIGAAVLAGIGFTMSLFFTTLGFKSMPELVEAAKLGILISSLLAAALGSAWIYFRFPSTRA